MGKVPLKPIVHIRRKRRALYITLSSIALVIGCLAAYVAYQYNALQPKNHFQNVPVIAGADDSLVKPQRTTQNQAGVFNLLILGSDMQSQSDTLGHADSIIIVHVNLIEHSYHMLSIPRDTRVYMPGYGYTKLTSVQYIDQAKNGEQQGIVDTAKAISELTGVPINYYAEANYWGLRDIVNAIGGINMYIPFNLTINAARFPHDDGRVFRKGTYFLNGETVADLVHMRHGLPGEDYGRQRMQEEALIGIAKAILQPANIIKLPKIAAAIPGFLTATNMSTQDMISFGIGVHADFHPNEQIQYEQVQGKDEVIYDDILKANNDEIVLDPGQLKAVINQFLVN